MGVKKFTTVVCVCILVLFTVLICACDSQRPNKRISETVGKYVYIDIAGVLHVKNGCKAVYKDHGEQEVRPYTLHSLKRENLNKICSQCVSEKQLTELFKISEYNYSDSSKNNNTLEYDVDRDDPYNEDFLK